MGQGANRFVGPAFAVGQAQAAVLIAAVSQGVPVFRYPPAQIKSSVADHGAASKEQVMTMVSITLGLDEESLTYDTSDALAIAPLPSAAAGNWRTWRRWQSGSVHARLWCA